MIGGIFEGKLFDFFRSWQERRLILNLHEDTSGGIHNRLLKQSH